jgi:hypothetical protein
MKEMMRIRSAKDVDALDQKIKEELGIEVSQYRNPEVAEKLVDLIVFPQFVVSWTIRPIILSLMTYVLLFYFIEFGAAWATVYLIFGLILFLLDGVLSGVVLVLWKLKKDMFEVVSFTLNIMKKAVQDLKTINGNMTKEDRKKNMKLLFFGIMHIVTIPTLSSALGNKIPLIGGLIKGVINRILRLIASTIKFSYDPTLDDDDTTDPKEITNGYIRTIDATIKGLDKVLSVIMRVAQTPFIIALFIALAFTALLLFITT